jgi:hypothetical protein
MVISHRYKYLFLENPLTGSTALSKRLVSKHEGQRILYKHANYLEFENFINVSKEEYFVFAVIRNPLDTAVSAYVKFLTDHQSAFTDPKARKNHGGWVTRSHIKLYRFAQNPKNTFENFLHKAIKVPGKIPGSGFWMARNKSFCDYIMKYERLDEDFSKILKLLGIDDKEPIEKVNVTKGKGHYEDYYNKESIDFTIQMLGPFMQEWGYELPQSWNKCLKIKYKNQRLYELMKKLHFYNCKYITSNPLIPKARIIFQNRNRNIKTRVYI